MLTKLIIEGFGLFKDKQVIDFSILPEDCIVGIFGHNNDGDGGYSSNGSAKSTFLNAISWCWFDKVAIQGDNSSGISTTTMINNDDSVSRAKVTTILNIDGDIIEFSNIRTKKGSKKAVSLKINGQTWSGNNPAQTREKFFSLLGIGGKTKKYFTDFLNSVYFTGEFTKSFASRNFSDKDRAEVIGRFGKLEVIDTAVSLADNDKDELEQQLSQLKTQLEFAQNQKDKLFNLEVQKKLIKDSEKKIEKLKKEYQKIKTNIQQTTNVNHLETKLIGLENNKTLIKNQIDELKKSCTAAVKNYNNYIDKKYKVEQLISRIPEDLADQINLKQTEITNQTLAKNKAILRKEDIIDAIDEKRTILQKLQDYSLYECPKCKSKLALDENDELIELNTLSIKQLEKEFHAFHEEMDKEIEDLNSLIKAHDDDIKILHDEKKDLLIKQNNLKEYKGNLSQLISTIEESYNELAENYGELLAEDGDLVKINVEFEYEEFSEYQEIETQIKKVEDELAPLKENLKGLEILTLDDLSDKEDEISEEKENLITLKNKIEEQAEIASKIESLSQDIVKIKQNIEIPKFWIDQFKILKNLELSEFEPILEDETNKILEELGTGIRINFKMDIDEGGLGLSLVEDSGKELLHHQFSKGQTTRIGLAVGLALRELNQEFRVDVGFTGWDEVLDGLDEVGQSKFFDILRRVNGRKFVISHDNNLKNSFEYRIKIERNNHKSTIKLEH